jgi:flavin reductase (DIM6/NTAB) family NADH-FMN oxidoreductase RutF
MDHHLTERAVVPPSGNTRASRAEADPAGTDLAEAELAGTGLAEAELASASWAAGVALVTAADGRDDVGTTVSAFCPVSADPPLVLVSLMSESYPAELFGRAADPVTRFAVTLLCAGQRVLAGRFAAAGRPGARHMLDDVPHRRGPVCGALIVDGGLAALECAAVQVIPAGDHLVVIARVTGVPYVSDAGAPLIRFRRHYLPIGSSGASG